MKKSMKTRLPALLAITIASILFSACRQKSQDQIVADLDELPQEIARTLDTATLSTLVKKLTKLPDQTKPNPALAPCCGSTDTRDLKVLFPYTKCGDLRDLLMPDLPSMALAMSGKKGAFRAYKLSSFQNRAFAKPQICFSSNGPWDARLTIERPCINYDTPIYTLIVSAFDDLLVFEWCNTCDIIAPPADLVVVDCQLRYTLESHCGGLSDCQCLSSVCNGNCGCTGTSPWPE